MIKEPRLRFTEEERADPALEKPIRKAEKAAAKADKAQAIIMRCSKAFGGTSTDKEVMQLAGVSVMTYYKYKKELKIGQAML